MTESPSLLTRMQSLRLIPPLEKSAWLLTQVQTVPGKLVLLLCFGGLLSLVNAGWPIVMVLLVVTSLLPRFRWQALVAGTALVALVLPNLLVARPTLTLLRVAVLVGSAAFYAAARRWPSAPLLRRPVLTLLLSTALYVAWLGWTPQAFAPESWQWQLATVLIRWQYFLCYALLDRHSPQASPVTTQIGTFAPFWGSSHTPFPKGAANLRKIEVKTPAQLAVAQLKGLKLLLWCLLLTGVYRAIQTVGYDTWHLTSMDDALQGIVNGTPPSMAACWTAALGNFVMQLLHVTLFGHSIIACCRMAGFAALRNTYRPLESRTIADFWNRYYYYFKELLVDVFYYPAFVRYFKSNPCLRRYFAVFAAVFFGNLYYHFFRDFEVIQTVGFVAALQMMDVYVVQCFTLAVAICVSQDLARRGASSRGSQLFALARVSLFYCCMFAFVDESFSFPLEVHLRFFGRMLGLNT
jgi:hypothetical protein